MAAGGRHDYDAVSTLTAASLPGFKHRMQYPRLLALFVIVAQLQSLTRAEEGEALSQLKPADYGRFEQLGSGLKLSPDGRWLAHVVYRVNGERELRLRMLATDTFETLEGGHGSSFSHNSKWMTYQVAPSPKMKPGTGKPKTAIRSLLTGATEEFEHVARVAFSAGGDWLAIETSPAKGQALARGRGLVIRHLETGVDTHFGSVGHWEWSSKDNSPLLAFVVDAPSKLGNGIRLWNAAEGTLRTLDSAPTSYHGLSWRARTHDLAVLREKNAATRKKRLAAKAQVDSNEKKPQAAASPQEKRYEVLAWEDVARTARRRRLDPGESTTFPKGERISSGAGVRWSKRGDAIFLGLKPLPPRRKPTANAKQGTVSTGEVTKEREKIPTRTFDDEPAPEAGRASSTQFSEASLKNKPKSLRESLSDPAGVEVWHAHDVDIMPLQKRLASSQERRTRLASWWLDSGHVAVLSSDLTERTRRSPDDRHVLAFDRRPYAEERKFGPTLSDVYVVDTKTAERTLLSKRLKFVFGASPTSRYVLYLKSEDFWIYDVQTRSHRNLTAEIDTSFVNKVYMTLTDEKSAWGVAGWTKDDRTVWLYDRYDVWEIPTRGNDAAKRLTSGAEREVTYRRVVIDHTVDDSRVIDADLDILFSLQGERSKKRGFALRRPGESVEELRFVDKQITRLRKARDADVFTWAEERFDDSPHVYVAGPELASPRKVTETNLFLSETLWGRAEVIDYENQNGEELQGALYYPAGYEPGKKYPMIVYIYERRSDGVHRFQTPSELHPYNTSVYTTRGYFVFQPDIVYRPQNPGLSAIECVVPAVKTVLNRGEVDPKRVGLVGHSWGAYQTAFIVTRSKLFAAGIAGAPLTNMMSMSMAIYWNSGQTNAWIFHESQGRMDRPFWKDVETYVANSPIFGIDQLDTPLLVAFGDKDGAVDWHQGIELYNAARLANKQLVMLVYAGENHSLAKKPNQLDYHYRIIDWFGHYLKGNEASKWITEGTSYLERKKALEAKKKKK